jgi:hypothetical protein
MTSVTYGMRKSLCKVMFDMYQGALASFLNNALKTDGYYAYVLATVHLPRKTNLYTLNPVLVGITGPPCPWGI